jgi:hypothetical protein
MFKLNIHHYPGAPCLGVLLLDRLSVDPGVECIDLCLESRTRAYGAGLAGFRILMLELVGIRGKDGGTGEVGACVGRAEPEVGEFVGWSRVLRSACGSRPMTRMVPVEATHD